MDDDLEYRSRSRLKLEEERKGLQICAECQRPMPEKAAFCPHCGPPFNLNDFSARRMSGFSAFFWILILCISFTGFLYYKEGGRWEELESGIQLEEFESKLKGLLQNEVTLLEKENSISEKGVEPEKEEKTYKVVMKVNIKALNVRSQATTRSKILGVLSNDEEVTIIESKNGWSHIKFKDKTGWVASRYLSAEIQ
jgi:hypothetical protein